MEHMVDEDSIGKAGANSEDLSRDLRHDIMNVAHCMQLPHANRADTMHNVRRMAYWPSAELSVSYFCDTCAVCLANRRPEVRFGSAMTSTERFRVLVIDKIVLMMM